MNKQKCFATHDLMIQILGCCLGFLISGSAQAQFLDFSQPARAAALGGNLVALPEGSSALAFNPAGLSLQGRFEASARYEAMFQGLEDDNISTGNISFLTSPDSFGALGGAWDHLGSNLLQQDRFSLAWGRKFPDPVTSLNFAVGISLSYITQRYILSQPLSGVSVSQLSSSSFGLGGGLLLDLPFNFTLGLSADNLNQPNLGVVGSDRIPALFRWGFAAKLLDQGPLRLTATGAQSLSDTDLETQGGFEVSFPDYGVRLRAGLGSYEGAVGAGFAGQDFFIDYTYLFSVSTNSQLAGIGLPGSQLLELGMQWGAAPSETAYGDRLQKARESEAAGQWDQALWCYQEMEALKPGDKTATDGRQRALLQFNLQRAGAYYKDGLAAEQKNSLLEARDDLEMASRLDPGNRNYSKALDRVTSKSQQPITVASSPSGKTAQLLTTESDLYLSKGRPDLAKKKLKEALKEQPQNPEIKEKLSRLEAPSTVIAPDMVDLANRLYEQGLQKYLGGDLDGAIRAWEDTLKADPSQTRAQNNLIHAKLEKEAEKP